jgi:polysaccharide biosynthesis protein PelC
MHKNWQIFVCALAVSGCVSSRVQQGGMPGAVHSANAIYVAPFHNATGNSAAGDAIGELVTTSLLSQNLPVVQSEATLQRGRDLANATDGSRDVLGLARAAYASHVVVGTVHEYRFKSDLDGAPTVGLTMRLVDTGNGETLWQGSSSASSGYYGSLSRTAQSAVNKLVRKMAAGKARVMPRDERPAYQASTPYYPETPAYQETRRTVSTTVPQQRVVERSYVTEQEAAAAWAAPVNVPPPSRYDPVGYDAPPAFHRSPTVHPNVSSANTGPRYDRASVRSQGNSSVRGPIFHSKPSKSSWSGRRSKKNAIPEYTEQVARRPVAAAQEAPPWAYDPPPQTIYDPVNH